MAGGAVGARFGYARTTVVSLLAAVPALIAVLPVPPGVTTLVLAGTAGALIYASQMTLVFALLIPAAVIAFRALAPRR